MPVTVLIVEDDFFIADDYAMAVEARGWQVLGPAPTAEEALALLQFDRPTVAVLDLRLRTGTSTAVAVALRVRRIPFIVSSGHEDIAALGGPLFKGISNVGKPAPAEVLIAALESVMGLSD